MAAATLTMPAVNALVNVSVYDKCCSKIVLPWTISEIENDEMSINELYDSVIQDIDVNEHELWEAKVGQDVNNLFPVKKLDKCVCIQYLFNHALFIWYNIV